MAMKPRNSTAISTSLSRTERKRTTDRRAQREHRNRQKAYVKDLEEKVRVLTSGSKTDDRITALLKEQMRLKELCSTLRVKLDRIRNITGDDSNATQVELSSNHSNGQSPAAKDDVQGVRTDPVLEEWRGVSIEEIFGTNYESRGDALLSGANQFEEQTYTSSQIFNTCGTWDHQISLGEGQISSHIDKQGIEYTDGECFGANETGGHSDEDSLPLALMITAGDENRTAAAGIPMPSLSTDEWSDATSIAHPPIQHEVGRGGFGMQIAPCTTEGSVPAWLCLPNYEPPCTYRESVYHDMIQEARKEYKAGRFDTSTPSLRRLLGREPVDILSFRLFHYMSTWGPLPMHLYLAVFWVHYLFLRWHILLSQESYSQLPEFLRPRHIERLAPHRIGINLLVWPDIRAVLIRDSDHLDPDAVAIDLTTCINPNWSAVKLVGCYTRSPASDPSSNLGMLKSVTKPKTEKHSESNLETEANSTEGCPVINLDVISLIESQASTFAFWSVERSFLNCYPCFKGCRLG